MEMTELLLNRLRVTPVSSRFTYITKVLSREQNQPESCSHESLQNNLIHKTDLLQTSFLCNGASSGVGATLLTRRIELAS